MYKNQRSLGVSGDVYKRLWAYKLQQDRPLNEVISGLLDRVERRADNPREGK